MELLLETWNSQQSTIGQVFHKDFWNCYKIYMSKIPDITRLFKSHQATHGDMFSQLAEPGEQTLETLLSLPVQRLADYGQYIEQLLRQTDKSHPDFEDLTAANNQLESMVNDRKDATGRVSDARPGSIEQNGSHSADRSPGSSREHRTRRKSVPSAILFKTLTYTRPGGSPGGNLMLDKKASLDLIKVADAQPHRMFVLEGQVQLAAGMQIQDRYMFLFTDLLLVAKQKSSSVYKLKHLVHLADMWIASCLEEVSETTRPPDLSFVVGWPTTNLVATFPTSDLKEVWLKKLSEHITAEKCREEGETAQLKVTIKDVPNSLLQVCELSITNQTQASDVLQACLQQLQIQVTEVKDHQLWVLHSRDGTPYPLIGHETPFSIKFCQAREFLRSKSGEHDLGAAVPKCEFFLKQKKSKKHSLEGLPQKSMKKNKKSPNFLNFFKRTKQQSLVFGQPLSEICNENDNYDPPESIIQLMVLVYNQGPNISGILRRGNNASLGKEVKEKICTGSKFELEDHHAPTAASVFKEFIRCVPEGLLLKRLHDDWLQIKKDDPEDVKIRKIKTVLDKLPPAHYRVVKLTICLLQHLAKFSAKTNMGATNLATCIAPSFCTPQVRDGPRGKNSNAALQHSVFEITNVFTPLISFMILKHVEIFGQDILSMFTKYGCQSSPAVNLTEDKGDVPRQPPLVDEDETLEEEEEEEELKGKILLSHQRRVSNFQLDSGTDSDSMHSLLSMPDTGMGLRQDDSSIDSFADRELLSSEMESSPKASKSHLSPTNLSRDSGLTLSDTQLYDEETGLTLSDTQLYDEDIFSKHARLEQFQYPDALSIDSNQNSHFIDTPELAAPLRKVSGKKSRKAHPVHSSSVEQLAAIKHSASTRQLDSSHDWRKQTSLDKENTFLWEEAEHRSADLHVPSTDMGTLVRSESGHFFFNDLPVITDHYSPVTTEPYRPSAFKPQHRFLRQSSVTEATPPASPGSVLQTSQQAQLEQSLNSTVTESPPVNSTVTESPPVNSTVTESPPVNSTVTESPPVNTTVTESPPVYSKIKSRGLSQSTFNLAELSPPELGFPTRNTSVRSGKFHEAEEIHLGQRPQFKVSIPEEPSSEAVMRRVHLLTGSPPPNVILKSLSKQVTNQFQFSKRLETLDFNSQGELSSHFSHSKSFKKSNSSLYASSKAGIVTCSDTCDKPPGYQQAVQRKLKQKIPVQITIEDTEKQREASARAKALYEQSLQIYNQQGQYGSSHERGGQYGSSHERGGQYGSSHERAGQYGSSHERAGQYGSSHERAGQYGSSHERGGQYGSSHERAGQYGSSHERAGQYGSSHEEHSSSRLSGRSEKVARSLPDVSAGQPLPSGLPKLLPAMVSLSDCVQEEPQHPSSTSSMLASTLKHSHSFGACSDISNSSNGSVSSVTSSEEDGDVYKQESQSNIELQELPIHFLNKKTPKQLYLESIEEFETKQKQSSHCSPLSKSFSKLSVSTREGVKEVPSGQPGQAPLEGQTSNTASSSEHHENFLQAKSYFHQSKLPMKSLIKHSASSPSIPMLFTQEKQLHEPQAAAFGQEHKSVGKPKPVPTVSATKPVPTVSATKPVPTVSATKPVPTVSATKPTIAAAKSKKKPELPWSVKDLKSKWDKTNVTDASSCSPFYKKPLQDNLHSTESRSEHEDTSANSQIAYI